MVNLKLRRLRLDFSLSDSRGNDEDDDSSNHLSAESTLSSERFYIPDCYDPTPRFMQNALKVTAAAEPGQGKLPWRKKSATKRHSDASYAEVMKLVDQDEFPDESISTEEYFSGSRDTHYIEKELFPGSIPYGVQSGHHRKADREFPVDIILKNAACAHGFSHSDSCEGRIYSKEVP
jgi:hypothetical protein